ncbi:phosphoadenosine phosphosulfate reductase domain-containing protein [Paenibacillus taichungensis]
MAQLTLFAEWEEKDKVPNITPRTIVQAALKPVCDEVREVIDRIKEAYLDPMNNRPWVIASSMGKDSTLLCLCIWIALSEIPSTRRTRQVYIISSDTGLENPGLKAFVHESIDKMKLSAVEQGLDCLHAQIVMPDQKNRFAAKVIAHGVPLSTPASPFRWCTDSFKISPTEIFIKGLLAEYGEVVIFTGVRNDESVKRAASIKRNGADEFIFQKYKTTKGKDGTQERKPMKGRFECHPIKEISDDVLWDTLMIWSKFPWKTRFLQLYALYRDTGECPMQIGEMKQSCGTSRNGCVICLFVKEDNMLKYFVDKGEDWASPILILRSIMRESLYDSNFREPVRKSRLKQLDSNEHPFIGKNQSDGQISLLDLETRTDEQDDELPYESLCLGGKPTNPDLALASFTLQGRIFLLKNVLYYQQQAGMELVTPEDIEYIKMVWKQEMGWIENEKDLTSEPVPYYGALVLDKEYRLKEAETTIPNLVVDPAYYAAEERLQYQKQEKEAKNLVQLERLKILNRTEDVTPETLNFVFYVTTDFGGGEEEIYDVLNRSKAVTGNNIPYFWMPVVAREKNRNVFWNNVTFIVSRPEIKTSTAARKFVDSFIESGCNQPPEEVYDWEKHYWRMLKGKSPFEARRVLYNLAMHPKHLSDELKSFADVNDEELMVAYAIKSSVGDGFSWMEAEKARDVCYTSQCWDEVFWSLLYEFRSPESVKQHLIEKGYVPQVVPEAVKFYADINDLELFFGNKVRVHGMRECLNSLLFLPDQHHKLPDFMKNALKKYIHELRAESAFVGT